MIKRLLVIGSTGQLGIDMCNEAQKAGYEVHAIDYPDIDITQQQSVDTIVHDVRPDCIINCAAFTAVDDCEIYREKAFLLNADGPGYLAEAAAAVDARMVHISTDYVFDGMKEDAYVEMDKPNPQTVYGKSKLKGEQRVAEACGDHQIFRIAWLYGLHGRNFVFNIRAAAKKRAIVDGKMSVVGDQFGTPTSTKEVCRQVLKAQQHDSTGIFHATCEGLCSWFEFARTIIEAAKIPVEVSPCTTAEHPRPAPRPKNSHLENERLKRAGISIMSDWREAFNEFLHDETAAMEA